MSDVTRFLQRRIKTTHSLKSVVKTMKTLSAINIVSYEKSVKALQHYYQTLKLGLVNCLLQSPELMQTADKKNVNIKKIGIIVFGSDQGMVGQFNDQIVDFVRRELFKVTANKIVWPVGDRIHSRLKEYSDLQLKRPFSVPNSIANISSLIGQILDHIEQERKVSEIDQLIIFYNKPKTRAKFEPSYLNLFPIDRQWLESFAVEKWPTNKFPEIVDEIEYTFAALIREHLFTSIFKACAESLASENASRLASMQLAEKHIDDLIDELTRNFNLERQSSIDEELFDVVFGFEAIISGKENNQ